MFEGILVGLDGSKHSWRAAEVGTELAKKFGGKLHLLAVVRPYKVSPKLKQFLEAENLLGEPKYVLDEMTDDLLKEGKRIATEGGVKSVESVVKEGKPARTIVDYAKRHKIDCIVLGSRGVGDTDASLLGSVSHKVSSLARCTVIIVR